MINNKKALYDKDSDDYVITFTDEEISELGWKEGDELVWSDLGNGSWSLKKKFKYHVIGYNREDFVSRFVLWETLKIFNDYDSALDYYMEMNVKNYNCKIVEVENIDKPYIIQPEENVTWEILI